ncbi:MAG: pilus assembly protein [Chloroflexi bacterium]|nr:pilus assembly protein [Chloroflexota bacterium]
MRRLTQLFRIATNARAGATARGQALVELAFLIPFVTVFVMGCLQFAVLYQAEISVVNATRDLARWLAVHPNTTDAVATAALQSRLPANLQAAQLTITMNPPCNTIDASGKCVSTPTRSPGNDLAVTLQYNASNIVFLPTTFQVGNVSLNIPTTLPAYTIHVSCEPG